MTPLSVNVVPQSRQWTTSWMSAHNTGRRLAEKDLSAWTRTREPGSPLMVSRSERHTQEEEFTSHLVSVYIFSIKGIYSRLILYLSHTVLCKDGDTRCIMSFFLAMLFVVVCVFVQKSLNFAFFLSRPRTEVICPCRKLRFFLSTD